MPIMAKEAVATQILMGQEGSTQLRRIAANLK